MEAAQLEARVFDAPRPDVRSGWRDHATGCWVVASTPRGEPDLWNQYLEGAAHS